MTWLRGKAKKYDGNPIDYVSIFNWPTGECIAQVQPDEMGNWKYAYYTDLNIGITYVADGCEPITHGAYVEPAITYPEFVDFIGAVNSLDRGGSSVAPMTTVIPATVQEGDMLVLGIMRRGEVTVTDNNNGVWTLGASSDFAGSGSTAPQSSTIYYRTAKAGDAGKTITVSTSYSGRLIVYLSVYRGKFAPLEVVKTVSNPSRYDDTYNQEIKNLAPIEHDGGFMVRAVSNAYAKLSGDTYADVIGMINTGDAVRDAANALRLQVAHKHLETGGILDGVTYNTGLTNSNDQIPDVAIILDEIGR